MRRARAGFTLVEIVAAMAVMALAMGLVVPAIQGGMRTREIWREARYFAGALRYLRREALATGQIQELVLSTGRHAYQATTLADPVELADSAAFLAVDGGNDLGGDLVRVMFYPNGGTSGLAVVIGSRDDPLGVRYQVQLDPLLGTVTIGDAGA